MSGALDLEGDELDATGANQVLSLEFALHFKILPTVPQTSVVRVLALEALVESVFAHFLMLLQTHNQVVLHVDLVLHFILIQRFSHNALLQSPEFYHFCVQIVEIHEKVLFNWVLAKRAAQEVKVYY